MSRTVPNTTPNLLTPDFTTVPSSAGFSSGDLVYYKDNNFGTIPGNVASIANFPITVSVSQNQMAYNTTVNFANPSFTTQTGSTNNRAPSAALLTNGNIVVVYGDHGPANGDAFFRIIDQNGVTIVDRTALGFTVQSMGIIGVAALTGGGFAVALKNNSGNMQHGVYSNTGTVVTALAQDTSFGSSFTTFDIKPLSGGGYAIGVNVGSGTYGFRTYSSVGVGGSYNTNAGWASNTAVVLTTFSDNTFAALYPLNSTQLQVTRFSNTGAIVASYNWGVSDLYNPAGYEFITLSTGTAVILHVENDTSSFFIRARTYTQSSGAFGGSTNLNNTALSQPVHARALAAGGFVMTNANSSTGTMLFTRRNDAFTQTAAFELVGMSGYCGSNNGGSRQNTTIIEGATWLTIIDNTYTSDNFSYHSLPYVQVDKSNFTLAGVRRRFAASTTVGSLPAPVSGYARSGSTPNSAALLAVNTQTLTLTVPASSGSTFFTTPSVVIGGPINCQCIADMLNGQFIIAYITTSGLVQFTSFSPACVPLTTVTVTSSSASPSAGTANIVKCICLGNGKLVVSWGSSASQVNYAVYSDTYALLATGNSTGLGVPSLQNVNSWNGAAGHDIAPFGNDSFVVAVCDASNNITVGTYTDSAVLVSQAQQTSPGGVQNIRIASDVSGDVAVRHFSSTAGSGYIYWFARNTTVNSIYYYNQVALSNYNQNNHGEGFALSPCGAAGGVYSQGGSKVPFKTTPSQLQLATALGGTTTFNSMGVCIGQYGEFVFFRLDGSPTYYRYSVAPSPGPWSAATVSQSAIQTVALTIANALTSGVGSQPQIINLYDNVYAISYITSGNGIAVGLINTIATTYSANLTAGVTPSGTALVPSPANGYYLAGVAATDCAAGGAGVVQINGAATLNSQYPAGTTPQAFDFNSPGLDVGVRGTIGGRNVILNGGK